MVVKLGWKTVFLVLLVAVVTLQVGCGVSEDSGGPSTGSNDNDIRLTLSLPSGETTIVADGQDSLPIRIAVTTRSGAGRSGVPVTFTTTNGTLSEAPAVPAARTRAAGETALPRQDEGETITVTTGGDGIAEVILTSSTTAGSARVTASVPPQGGNTDGFRTSTTVFFAFPVAAVEVLAIPATVVRDTTSVIRAIVRDDDGDPVANEPVTFAIVSNVSGSVLTTTTAVTGNNGRAEVTYTAGAILGVDTIEARTGNGTANTIDVTVVQPDVANVTLALVGNPEVVADGSSAVGIRASVTDSAGTGIPGVIVTFATSAGTLSALTATTDISGIAMVDLIASTVIGTADVTASADGVTSNRVSARFIAAPPETVTLVLDASPISTGGQANLTATVLDLNGNPVSGTTLTLSIQPNASGGSLLASTGTTNASGRLTTIYTAGNTPGTDTLRALTTNSVVGMLQVVVTEGEPPTGDVANILIISGANTLVADGTSTVGIQATAVDADGVGLPGITVTFTTTAGRVAAETVTTDADGIARVNLIAATNLGTATVTAAAEGFRRSTTVAFVAGAPALVRLTPAFSTVNTGEASEIVVAVFDANDNPVAQATLTFSLAPNSSGATLDFSNGVTNNNGRFTLTYSAGTASGTDTVQAETTNNIIGTVGISVTPLAVAGRIDLLVSSPQLDSDGSETVGLTALVRDADNNAVPNATVAFRATSGLIQLGRNITDGSGTATAVLLTGGDPANRSITVTATIPTTTPLLTSTNTVTVTGTTLTLSGAGSVVLGEERTISILLQNSGGLGIANTEVVLTSALGNSLSAPTVTTDTNGQATVTVTAMFAEVDTITATALNATAVFPLNVSAANFIFNAPAEGLQIPLGETQQVVIHWDENGVNQVGETINFFATRGSLSATSAVTNANGNARVTISSLNAGPAVITAVATRASGPSSQIGVSFIATMPRSLILQAAPTTLRVNLEGATDQQSILTAVVRDADGNLVQNQEIRFTLIEDDSGGSISPSSARTDSFGQASTIYTAGNVPTAQDGVIIDAEVIGTEGCTPTDTIPAGPCDRVTLTVGGQELFITLGTGNLIEPLSATQYRRPYSVLVTDANGNPVSTDVELNVFPTRYQKGFYTLVFDIAGNCVGWGKSLTINPGNGGDDLDQACRNEDSNRNGLLNEGEDDNNNGILDPTDVAAVPMRVTTDASGFALFGVDYAREFTWVEVQLEARARVAGSEASNRATFILPGLADDFNDCLIAPPGQISPFGVATTCTCDDRFDPTCPTRNSITPVLLNPPSITVIQDVGGNVVFTPSGGTETAYDISSTSGTLSATTVGFGGSFTLQIPRGSTGTNFIIVTATDTLTRQTGSATVTLTPPPALTITPSTVILTEQGTEQRGPVVYNIAGGTETSYVVTLFPETPGATLRNADGSQEDSRITVSFGEPFTLNVSANQTTTNITFDLTVADGITGDESTATVEVLPLADVSINPSTRTIFATGGVLSFNVTGGSGRYSVSADLGTLTNQTTGDSNPVITVNSGEIFLLDVPENTADAARTIRIIARDNGVFLPDGEATVTQSAP